MTKFTIDKNIKKIDDFFYIEFMASNEFYSNKAKTSIKLFDLNLLDEEAQRQTLFILLSEQYQNFTLNFYL